MSDEYRFFLTAFNLFEYAIIAYVAAINVIYFATIVLGFYVLRHERGRLTPHQLDVLGKSPLLPPVAIIAPAYNESATIRDSVRGMLLLHYQDHEVIVVNDGSKDEMLAILIDEFQLYRSARVPTGSLPTKPIRAIYESRDPAIHLVVVDKENGGKSDSANAGINVARAPLVAVVDSDSLLESDSLLMVVKPFLEDPTTLATGGIVRVVNGCEVRQGQVVHVATPRSLIARFQVVEYLRAFLGGRVAFSFLNSLLLISGAFGLFRRDAVVQTGGFLTETVGEDMEMVIRFHRLWRTQRRPYRITFVPDPVCWTEVPETLRILKRQRNRWQRGTVESLWKHRVILFNPRFGVVGLFASPYFALFEMFGPVVELTGYIFTIVGFALGLIGWQVAVLFLLASVLFGILLSLSSILLEELTTRRYPSPRDLGHLLTAAVIENVGFRQLMTIWRTKAMWDAARGKSGWGVMKRRGFQKSTRPLP